MPLGGNDCESRFRKMWKPGPIAEIWVQETGAASAVKTHEMGVRVEVREDESIVKALRRFKVLCEGAGIRYKLYERELERKPSDARRRKRYRAKIQAWRSSYLKRLELGLIPAKQG